MAVTPSEDEDHSEKMQNSLAESARRHRERAEQARRRYRDMTEHRLDSATVSLPPAVGRGRRNSITVEAPARAHSGETTISQVERRLTRLSETKTVDRHRLGETTVALDFELFAPGLGYQEANERAMKINRKRGLRTGGGTAKSVIILRTDTDRPVITEFVVRLDSPSRRPQVSQSDKRRTDVVLAVRDLVTEVCPPVDDTQVWLRPTLEESVAVVLPPSNEREFLRKNHPHIGARGVSVHPSTLLGFIADLLDAYPERLTCG